LARPEMAPIASFLVSPGERNKYMRRACRDWWIYFPLKKDLVSKPKNII
jgi:hypothetical protein